MTRNLSDFPDVPASGDSDKYAPHPTGAWPMVCVDAIYLGEKADVWQGKERLSPKCVLIFASGQRNSDGDLILVSPEFTYNLGDKANLRKFLEQWRAEPYRDEEHAREKAKLPKMIGAAGIGTVAHKKSQRTGRSYAVLSGISPLVQGMAKPVIEGYVRGDWWLTKAEEYAKSVADYHRRHSVATDDDFGADDGDDDLGF